MMNKIRKGDQVIVLPAATRASAARCCSRVDDEHLVVEGVNVVKKHVKPNPMKGTTGGVVDKTMPIHQSNVAHLQPGHRQGRPRRHQAAGRRQEGARVQEQRRTSVERRRQG